jgi:ATP-dependent Lon protease
VLAAHRAGVKKVILPEENEKDLEEVPDFVKQEMQFSFVKNVDEIMAQVLKGGIRKAGGKGVGAAKKEATPAKAGAKSKA